MKTILLTFLFITITYAGYTQNSSQPLTANDAYGFVPKGWKLLAKANGDLNKDGKPDLALIIEKTDKKNFIKNDNLGADTLNINPRRIIVAFADTNSYRLVIQNENFVPAANEGGAPCLEDPLYDMENNGLNINRGLLFLSFKYWSSCGTWYVNSDKYTFRWQNNKFQLIGFDTREFHRGSLDETKYSINYSTGIIETTTGGNLSGDERHHPKTTRKKLKKKATYDLAIITIDADMGIE